VHHHNNSTSATAMPLNAMNAFTVCALASAPSPAAPLLAPAALLVAAEDAELELELDVRVLTLAAGAEGLEEVEVAVELVFVAGPLPPPLGGAGLASPGCTRAPLPQGMGAPEPGCVACGGGVVRPVASAIAKRVVQVRLLDAGDVN